MAARELGTLAANQRLAQRAALMTRAHKREVDSEALRENWEKQAVDLGFDARALAAEAIAKGAVSPDMGKEAVREASHANEAGAPRTTPTHCNHSPNRFVDLTLKIRFMAGLRYLGRPATVTRPRSCRAKSGLTKILAVIGR